MEGQVNNVVAFFVCLIFAVGISVGTLMAFTFLYIVPHIDEQFKKVYAKLLEQSASLKLQGDANTVNLAQDRQQINTLLALSHAPAIPS